MERTVNEALAKTEPSVACRLNSLKSTDIGCQFMDTHGWMFPIFNLIRVWKYATYDVGNISSMKISDQVILIRDGKSRNCMQSDKIDWLRWMRESEWVNWASLFSHILCIPNGVYISVYQFSMCSAHRFGSITDENDIIYECLDLVYYTRYINRLSVAPRIDAKLWNNWKSN